MTRYSKTMAKALLEVRNPSVDSKMPSSYSKTMGQALDEMYSVNLVEGTIDKIKDIVSKKQHSKIDGVTVDLFTASAISQIYDKVNDANKKKMEKLPINKLAILAMKMMKKEDGDPEDQYDDEEERQQTEEVDLDEGKMAQMHQMMKDKKSAAQIAKEMGLDVKTVKALMAGYNEEVEIDEHKGDKPHKHPHVDEGAAADARRSIGRDKDLGRKRDSADDDDDADEDDVKAASKNIMMQLRKSVSLRGKFDVEFMDRKKVKVDSKIAQAVAAKYMTLKRPAEKEKFQNKISKSYKDMLNALKENKSPIRETIKDMLNALKENKSPIRETILKRIATKLMERKNG